MKIAINEEEWEKTIICVQDTYIMLSFQAVLYREEESVCHCDIIESLIELNFFPKLVDSYLNCLFE
jgi:hypothetical protein